jgi:ribonuclease HI
MPTRIGQPSTLTPAQQKKLLEQQLAEALQQLEQERHRANAMEAKLRELNIPLDFLPPSHSENSQNSENQPAPKQRERISSPGMMKTIQRIYTDGACSGNPGPGGWGTVVYFSDGSVHEMGAREAQTTNNRMEMQAAVAALQYLADSGQTGTIELYTDSEYLKNGITKWIHGWKKKDWKTSTGKPVLNQDLWETLDALNSKRVQWRYVRGHAGDEGNERCDTIARTFSLGKTPQLRQKP